MSTPPTQKRKLEEATQLSDGPATDGFCLLSEGSCTYDHRVHFLSIDHKDVSPDEREKLVKLTQGRIVPEWEDHVDRADAKRYVLKENSHNFRGMLEAAKDPDWADDLPETACAISIKAMIVISFSV
tara:strand:+ start:145 stop:525 length:381 start_codon:yes stop_codon:yes gene_type:complete